MATTQLESLFGNMFDNADDALFELAHKTSSETDQTMYFDSMREVRIQRRGMEAQFAKKFQEGFRKLYLPEDEAAEEVGGEEPGLSGLSLMQDDELEEAVAVRGMVSKATNQNAESLAALTQRAAHLIPSKTVTDTNNPLGPQRLCEAFSYACNLLALDIRAKLVVYKLFERYVLGNIDELYDEANQLLIEKGVLPQIGGVRKIRKSSSGAGPKSPDQEKASKSSDKQSGSEKDDAELFDFLRGLLSDSGITGKGSGLPVEQGPVLPRDDLVHMLSTIQHQNQDISNMVSMQAQQLDLRQALHNQIQQFTAANQARSIGRVDDDVINLVSMLFEFILDDHNLSSPMKALLARLQIPLLKVAILDKSFFSRGGHPARKLLNELATAALGWSETADLSRDKLYLKISEVVGKVLNEFDDNVSLFQDLLDDFTEFVEVEKRRASLIERRTRDAEEGMGRTQQARALVGEILNSKAQGKNLPAVAVELLREGWSNYLFLIHVKDGVESSKWQDALQTVDDLIWSVQPAKDKERSGELLKLIPGLLQRLRKGLADASFSKARMRILFKDLETIHLECLRAPSQQQKPSARVIQPEENSAAGQPPGSAKPDAIIASPVIIDKENLPPIEEVTESPAEEQDEHLARVDALSSGTWVELIHNDKKQRAKLVAVIKSTGKFIFVNRVGMKVAEKTRMVLAQEFRDQAISILDDSLLFDRALESVIGNLRQLKA